MLTNIRFGLSIICTKLSIGLVGSRGGLNFSPTDDLDELMDGLVGDFASSGGSTLYEGAIHTLNVLFQYLLFQFTGHGLTPVDANNWGIASTVSEEFLTFATLLAIFVFFWGVAKSNLNFDRPDAWKSVLGRVLLAVIVITSMNYIYDIVSFFQDLAASFMTEVLGMNTLGATPVAGLVEALQGDLQATSEYNNDISSVLSKIAFLFTAVAVCVGIVKKVIDIIRDCIPVVIEMYVYTWFLPVGLAWLASPETRQKFMSYAGGFLGAFFTNVMRILCIIFLVVIANQPIGFSYSDGTDIIDRTYTFFQIGDIMRDSTSNVFVHLVLASQSYGINILFALGVLDLLMKGSEKLSQRIVG